MAVDLGLKASGWLRLSAAGMVLTALITALVPVHHGRSSGPESGHHHLRLAAGWQASMPPGAQRLSRAEWFVSADSAVPGAEVSAVLDGNPDTGWRAQWSPSAAQTPHWLSVDMRAPRNVAGLAVLPQQEGRIGRYEVHVSTDGTDWGNPVAHGTFVDAPGEQILPLRPVTARYLRLTALPEEGNQSGQAGLAEITVLAGTSSAPGEPAAATSGQWGQPIGFPLVPAAAAVTPDGKLVTWAASTTHSFSGGTRTETATVDLANSTVSQRVVTETGHDMFCPGTSMLSDGRVIVTGGNSSGKTSIYQPATATWVSGPDMGIRRGYQSTATLSTGGVFVLGGSWNGGIGGKDAEEWTERRGWRRLPGVSADSILTADPEGTFRGDNHGWFFGWRDGTVFHAGPSKAMHWFSTSGLGAVTDVGPRGTDTDSMNGVAVMYDVGKILTAGGAPAYGTPAYPGYAHSRAHVIDINNPERVTAREVSPMTSARGFHNGVVLPDGKVLMVGGQSPTVIFTDDNAVLRPELWDPVTEKFTAMAPMLVPRTYHSVAILLPDGRVFTGGGGLCGDCRTNHADSEIFSPPYLFTADGTPAARPAITAAPDSAGPGAAIRVTTDRAVAAFSLVRMSSVTHSVNTDQRRIPLVPTRVSGTTYTLTVPNDGGVVLPGAYLLFALDSAGVPSVAKIVQVGGR